MFGLDAIGSLAGGLAGGGGGPSSAKASQDGSSLSSGGSFSVGGGKTALWLGLLAVAAVAGFFLGRAAK